LLLLLSVDCLIGQQEDEDEHATQRSNPTH